MCCFYRIYKKDPQPQAFNYRSPYLPIQLAAVASSYTATSVDLTDRHVTGSY